MPTRVILSSICLLIALVCFNYWSSLSWSPEQAKIVFWDLRLPRSLLAFLAGGLLALVGLVFQAIFQNSLASPYTSGVSSAAAVGAALVSFLGISSIDSGVLSFTSALLAATLAITMILLLLKILPGIEASALIICGLICNYIFSSLLLLLQFLSDPGQLYALTRWLIGNINIVGYQEVIYLGVLAGISLPFFAKYWREFDLISLGDEIAISKGLDIKRFRKQALIAASVIVAVVVALVGPIGFVGIIIPHFTRMLTGFSHRTNILCSFFLGAAFLLLSDFIARSIYSQIDLPVGLITTLIGGPVFISLLLRKRDYKFF